MEDLNEVVSKKFRKMVKIKYRKRKDHLGKAFDSVLKDWMTKRENEDIYLLAIKELRKGYRLGKITYKDRAELHER